MTTLVIAAHPDDEVLGCGGTISRLAQEGEEVGILILGEGVTSRKDLEESQKEKMLQELHSQSEKVAKMLGAQEAIHSLLPDNRFDSVPLLDIIQKIESVIEKLKPHTVYTQHGGDLNIDHQITFKATMTAVRPMQKRPVKALYTYETLSSSEWSFGKIYPEFKPSRFTDISQTLTDKLNAMNIYEDELRSFPHPRSEKAIVATAQKWGATVGFEAAEAFEVVFEKV